MHNELADLFKKALETATRYQPSLQWLRVKFKFSKKPHKLLAW